MAEFALSRRTFLTAAGLGAAALLAGCDIETVPGATLTPITNPPKTSPFVIGPYQTDQVILGETAGTAALRQPLTQDMLPNAQKDWNYVCVNGLAGPAGLPATVPAAVYYPYFGGTDHRITAPNPLHIADGPFPILLYAHALRLVEVEACMLPDPHRDFTSVDVMLGHVASYGCVCIAPDLSFIVGDIEGEVSVVEAFDLRATVLLAYFSYLAQLNSTLFANQLDLSRVMFVGHSTGGGSAIVAGSQLASVISLKSLSFGLLGPYFGGSNPMLPTPANESNLLVVKGSLDTVSGPGAMAAYTAGSGPKTFVTIPGANHFGYTGLCQLDNTCGDFGTAGTISRAGQQQTGAAYLAAALRYYALGDLTARPYLTGAEQVEGLEIYGVSGIQVQSEGFKPGPVLTAVPTHAAHP